MYKALIALLLLALPAAAYDYRYVRYQPGHRSVIRTSYGYPPRAYRVRSTYSQRRAIQTYGYGPRDSSWRLNRFRRASAHQDPYSYGRCYWRGYYRPRLYCRKYTPRYSYYQSVTRYPGPAGLRGPSYPGAYALPAYGVGYGVGYYGYAYPGVTQSRYGYRYPHAYYPGGSGPYGFHDPWGYRLLPAFDFAPILTRLTTVYTIDDPAFDGPSEDDAPADGLPQPRTKPVGDRFLSPR